MDTRNIGHPLPNRISKRKGQYWNECPNETRKSDNSEKKKNIS